MKPIFLLLALAFPTAVASASELFTEAEEHASGVAVYARNEYFSPVTIALTVDADNMEGSASEFLIVPAKTTELLFDLTRQDKRRSWRYSYEYKYQLGKLNAEHSRRAVYNLPFKRGTVVKGGQGFNGAFSHQGNSSFAVDFPVPEGTPVYPAREGVVVKVIEKYSEGGTDEKFRPLGNAVWIIHDDGTVGRYLHFKHEGIEVEPGQEVDRNTVLGFSGNTGYSTGPHLHFEVGAPNKDLEFNSIEFFFTNKKGEEFTVVKRRKYTVDR